MSDIINQTGAIATNVDLVYCIDGTGSMSPCIEATKKAAKSLHSDIVKALAGKSRIVQELRLKIIVFRDFSYDDDEAIEESKFFTLPDEITDCEAFINKIEAKGGGEEPESALEALHLAFNSKWKESLQGDFKRRHVVVLFTDASAHKLNDVTYREKAETNDLYPNDVPRDLNEFMNEWDEKMDDTAKRLVIFAPDAVPWNEFGTKLDQCMITYARAGAGLNDVTNQAIMEMISSSILQQ